MTYCAKNEKTKTASCKKTPCEVDNNTKDCFVAPTNRCRIKKEKPALTKKAPRAAPKKASPAKASPAKASPAKASPAKASPAKAPLTKKASPVLRRSARIASRAAVLHGNADATPGGLKSKDLIKTKAGIRSRKKHRAGKKNKWALAVKSARKTLKAQGFVTVQKPKRGVAFEDMDMGEKIYTRAMETYAGVKN